MKFTAVAFDLDGTLYPAYRLNFRIIPFILKEQRLLRTLGRARKQLRISGAYDGDFYDLQAKLMAGILGQPAAEIKERTERLIYRGWEPLFEKIKLFPHVRETLAAFRKEGITMGLLSDFPPKKKLEYMNISEYWDAVVCSEETGRLKPDPAPFLELARLMKRPPEEILYVGNSVSYDVKGAGGVGMKTALVRPLWRKCFSAGNTASRARSISARSISNGSEASLSSKETGPDFVFYDYRQLFDYVLH